MACRGPRVGQASLGTSQGRYPPTSMLHWPPSGPGDLGTQEQTGGPERATPQPPYLHELPHRDGSVTWVEGRAGHVPDGPFVPTARQCPERPPPAGQCRQGAGPGLQPPYPVSWRGMCTHVWERVHLRALRGGRAGARKADHVDGHVWFSMSVATAATQDEWTCAGQGVVSSGHVHLGPRPSPGCDLRPHQVPLPPLKGVGGCARATGGSRHGHGGPRIPLCTPALPSLGKLRLGHRQAGSEGPGVPLTAWSSGAVAVAAPPGRVPPCPPG